MELYEDLFGRYDNILESLDFAINQFKKSKLTLSSIQHKKVLPDIDMDFEELIGILLSSRIEIKNLKFDCEIMESQNG